MHGHETLDHLLVVFPLLLVCVIIAVCLNLEWQIYKIYIHSLTLNGLDGNFFTSDRVSNNYDTLV